MFKWSRRYQKSFITDYTITKLIHIDISSKSKSAWFSDSSIDGFIPETDIRNQMTWGEIGGVVGGIALISALGFVIYKRNS